MISIGIADVLRVSPLIALFLASLIPITIKVLNQNQEQAPQATLAQAIGGILAAGILLLTITKVVARSENPTAFMHALVFDGVTMWIGLIALISTATALLLAYDNPATNGEQFSELTFLILNSLLGMLVLVAAVDLLLVFIGIEIMSLSLYLMIGMSHEQRISKEAALKYFILGGFASAILLYGISFVFGSAGSTYIHEVIKSTETLSNSSPYFLIGMGMILISFAFKASIVPFQAWTPDVYHGSPTPHTALMATAVKAVVFASFLRIIASRILVEVPALFDFLQWLAVLTMIVGNLGAIIQSNFKRMLAYSSISHSGYLLVGIIATGISDDLIVGGSSIIFYLLSYSFMTLGAFGVISLMEKKAEDSVSIDSLSGYAHEHPVIAASLSVFLLSLAGIPPLLGFFGKFYLFASAISQGLFWLALWGVLNSVISVYYYLRPIVVMYMVKSEENAIKHYSMNATRMTLIIMAILVALLGLLSGIIFEGIEKALM